MRRKQTLSIIILTAVLLIAFHATWFFISHVAAHEPRSLVVIKDPFGDDTGDGSLLYPTDESFPAGVFDLTQFAVLIDNDFIRFRFQFANITNPWHAPEGFYHQRIDVFIHTVAGTGKTTPLRPGPGIVHFDERYPWDTWLRIAPWEGAQLFYYHDDPDEPGRTEGIHVGVVGDYTIEARVPRHYMEQPSRDWRYYVLVGSFDALGVDGYRTVQSEPSQWLLQGDQIDLRIVDVLARPFSIASQQKQLQPDALGMIVLHPVYAGQRRKVWFFGGGVFLIAFATGVFVYRKRT